VFLLCYLILALTFGFTLLITEISIGRKTGKSPLAAYAQIHPRMGWIGVLACLIPTLILPYYSAIGGWVLKYLAAYLTGNGMNAVADNYFTGFITAQWEPIIWFLVFLGATMVVVYKGVDKGIEKFSTVLMPLLVLLIMGIAAFSLFLSNTDDSGVTRTGLQGFKVYIVPNFEGMTAKQFLVVLTDAMGQLFYSISVAMGIMITYGSYVKKDTDLNQAVNRIEFFDTLVAFLAGMMIIPAVYTFMGREGMSASGPALMFVALPKVFGEMGSFIGTCVGVLFFLTVAFAALTSSVSIMEAIVSCAMDKFRWDRKKSVIAVTLVTAVMGIVVCLGYNVLYFEAILPNTPAGKNAQILDILDYISNYILMPVVSIATCIFIGWIVKPKTIIEEVTHGGHKFGREKLYVVMIKFVTPVLLTLLLLQALGLIKF
jgi:NSS family neurotransmitter:Na+ symporter